MVIMKIKTDMCVREKQERGRESKRGRERVRERVTERE